jgi:hypothetical protein
MVVASSYSSDDVISPSRVTEFFDHALTTGVGNSLANVQMNVAEIMTNMRSTVAEMTREDFMGYH